MFGILVSSKNKNSMYYLVDPNKAKRDQIFFSNNIHDHLGLMKRRERGYFSPILIGGIKMWLKLGCKVHTENEKGAYKKELLIETYLTLAILSISYKIVGTILQYKKGIFEKIGVNWWKLNHFMHMRVAFPLQYIIQIPKAKWP